MNNNFSNSPLKNEHAYHNAAEQSTAPSSSSILAAANNSDNDRNNLVNDVWFQEPLRPHSSAQSQRSTSSTTLPSTIMPSSPPHHQYQSPKNNGDEEWITDQPLPASYTPRTYPTAWVALFFLVILRCAVAIFQNTFSPIPNVVANYLNVGLTGINWLYNVVSVVYSVVSFGTGWLYEVLGPKKTVS